MIVCGPENNFGFVYSSVDIYFNNPNITACPGPIPGSCDPLATFTECGLNHYECCAACYNGINGCYAYGMDLTDNGGVCQWTILNTGGDPSSLPTYNIGGNTTLFPGSPHCPNGNTHVVKTEPGNSHGVGPCAHGWLEDAY
jgi:hypothetical protein